MDELCPLTNKPCNKAKLVHVTEILEHGDIVNEFHLCEDCADTYVSQIGNQKGSTLSEAIQKLLETVGHIIKDTVVHEHTKNMQKACPACGITVEQILQLGRLGCPQCYEHLSLDGLVQNLQNGATKHVGKVPKQSNKIALNKKEKSIPLDLRIADLNLKLKQSIECEKYETAGMIHNAIGEIQEYKRQIDKLKQDLTEANTNQQNEAVITIQQNIELLLDRCSEIERDIKF
jgi:protein arginine kinase activator